jgi:hypothetical protein
MNDVRVDEVNGTSSRVRLLSVAAALLFVAAATSEVWAGAYLFSHETLRPDVVTHPKGYTGSGGNCRNRACQPAPATPRTW